MIWYFETTGPRSGVYTTFKYISVGCPVSLRSLSSSTIHPRYGTHTSVKFCPSTARVCSAQSRPSRSSLRPHTPPSHTPTCRSRRVGVHKAKDRSLSRRWPRMLSCDACRQHEVRALMHMAHGPTIAAHLRSRPSPTSAGPASNDIKDRAPLTNEEVGRRGSGDIGLDTPAGQKLITTAVSKVMEQGGRAQRSQFGVRQSYWSQRRPPTPLKRAPATF